MIGGMRDWIYAGQTEAPAKGETLRIVRIDLVVELAELDRIEHILAAGPDADDGAELFAGVRVVIHA